MNDKKFEDMMENWASHEMESAPQLRPKKEIYQMVKAKKRKTLFPVFARWATVGVAAAAIVLVAILHPALFLPSTYFERAPKKEELSVKQQKEEGSERGVPVSKKGKADDIGMVRTTVEESAMQQEKKPETKLAFNKKEEAETVGQPAPAQAPPPPVPEDVSDSAISPAQDKNGRHLQGDVKLTPQTNEQTQVIAKSRALSETRKTKEVSTLAAPTPGVARELYSDTSSSDGQLTESDALISEKAVEEEKKIGVKTFQVKNGVWVDTTHSQKKELIKIKRGSQAYHDLIKALPELKTYFEIEQKVIVNIGKYSIELADDGKTELKKDELEKLVKEYNLL
jgi:hypothetical protein